jgi:hypothetical protein
MPDAPHFQYAPRRRECGRATRLQDSGHVHINPARSRYQPACKYFLGHLEKLV